MKYSILVGAALAGIAIASMNCGEDTDLPSTTVTASTGPGAGGAGGEGCLGASDCPRPNACVTARCDEGVCGLDPLAAGTPLGTQQVGDCHQDLCDGSGAVQTVVDDDDPPTDDNECTTDTCMAGMPVFEPVGPGTDCAAGGVCDDMGNCNECNVPTDCPGMDDECQARTCEAGMCGVDFTEVLTSISVQTTGDCQVVVCDGSGMTMSLNDDNDIHVDFNDCTLDMCVNGAVTHPPEPQGLACGVNSFCDGNGSCVGCVLATDCPGTDDFCKQRTCTNNVCGFDFTPPNTPLPSQQPGNCLLDVCDGMGTVQSSIEDTDTPVDGQQCTNDVCNMGVPSNPPVMAGTMCNQGGGSVCNLTGQCVQCNVAANCPPTGQPCKIATCISQTCGQDNLPSGTVCGASSCMAGVQQNHDTCNTNGQCIDGGSMSCTPYVCGLTTCTNSCVNDNGCAGGYSCDTGLGTCTNGPKCTDYCNAIQQNCTIANSNQQYSSVANCLDVCELLPPGLLTDTGGQHSVGCRSYHGGAPSAADPNTHCTHGGPGGDGVCGTNCQGYCTIAMAACTGNNTQYGSMAACMTACAAFPITPKYTTSVVSGPSLACHLYHATQAATAPGTHCNHLTDSTCQ